MNLGNKSVDKKNSPRKRSTGELISSCTFFAVGVWLIVEGISLLQSDELITGLIGISGGILSTFATFRFQIQAFVRHWRK
jgi:hypothetical protein